MNRGGGLLHEERSSRNQEMCDRAVLIGVESKSKLLLIFKGCLYYFIYDPLSSTSLCTRLSDTHNLTHIGLEIKLTRLTLVRLKALCFAPLGDEHIKRKIENSTFKI